MTNRQILEKALLKAHKNGWQPLTTIDWKNVQIEQWQGNGMVGIALLYGDKGADVHWVRELEGIIFNHDFAKALWGEDGHTIGFNRNWIHEPARPIKIPEYKYHLQQMIIADDPIKYLGDNL